MKNISAFFAFSCSLLCPALCPAAAPARPKLILAVVIDQFRYDYLTRFQADYRGGLARLLSQGAVFTGAHYIHAPTVTAIGHSTFLSGALPSVSGIIGNEWYDRGSGKVVTSVSDASTKLLGGGPGEAGSSPRRLLVSGFTDEMKIAGRATKVIGVSIKDRSAILPAGHMADGAYWFDDKSKHFVSSTYYAAALPGWASEYNASGPAARYRGAEWRALGARPGDKPFCTLAAGGDARRCGSIEATPFGNELIESFAERAVAGERLGTHAGVDVLTLSFSSNDYVGHALGPDAPEVRDISIRTDLLLGKLLDFIGRRLGAGHVLVVLTADHGVAPVPEVNAARKMPGGRLDAAQVAKAIQSALTAKFGEGEWLIPHLGADVYLNYETASARKADLAKVRRAAAEAVRALPHIARVYTRDQIERGAMPADTIGAAIRNGHYGPRSGDLAILAEPYYIFSARGTTHGTPYGYDTHVPVIFWGPGVKAGVYHRNIAVNDVAPTLAAMFGVEPPSGAFGQAIRELLP